MRTEVTVTEQMTSDIDFGLLRDSDEDGVAETGINLTGVDHVELWRRNKGGSIDSFTSGGTAPTLSFPTNFAAAGSIRWSPGTADLIAAYAPYYCQFKVFETASKWYYVPEDSRFTIAVQVRLG